MNTTVKKEEEKHIVACYGTLMEGYGNHGCLGKTPKMLGAGKTDEKMLMTASGIPFVSKSKPVSQIHVEVYEVDDDVLYRLDCLEGHPRFYERQITDITLENGEKTKAWMYFCDRGSNRVIETGNYKDYRKS